MTTTNQLTALHKALGDPTRLRILSILDGSELRVSEIVEILEMGQSRISRHLKILVDAGVLIQRRSGVWTFYRRDTESPYRELVDATAELLPVYDGDHERKDRVLSERRDETRRFFDRRAQQWDSMKRELFGAVDPDGLVLSRIHGRPRIADLGCGDGSLVARMGALAQSVIGVDNAPAMIEYARSRYEGLGNTEFRLGEVEHLPLSDGEVDCAVMSLVLHHLPAPAQAITEAARVLAPGGVLVVLEFEPHGDERLREAHGDRWLGIDGDRVETWLHENGLIRNEREQYRLSEAMTLYAIVASKTNISPPA